MGSHRCPRIVPIRAPRLGSKPSPPPARCELPTPERSPRLSSCAIQTSERQRHFREHPACSEQNGASVCKGKPGGAWSTMQWEGGPATGPGSCNPHRRREGTPCPLEHQVRSCQGLGQQYLRKLLASFPGGKAWRTAFVLALVTADYGDTTIPGHLANTHLLSLLAGQPLALPSLVPWVLDRRWPH